MTKLRISSLQKNLKNTESYLIENPYDLFYFTGLQISLGYLIIAKKRARLFVDGRYFEIAKKNSPIPVEELKDKNLQKYLKGAKTLLFNGSNIVYDTFSHFQKLARKEKCKMVSDPQLPTSARLIKDKSEIALLKKSATFAYKAYQYIRKKLRTGVSEIELAKELEIYSLKNGAEKMSFEPIVAFGKNSALPHHHPGKTKLKANDIALFDLGVVLNGYASDMTRVDFFGKPDPKLKKIYDVNKAAQKAALKKCKPGVKLKELDITARKVMAKEGLEEYYVHSLGHGIGLEVHEAPRISHQGADKNKTLLPGMAITIEPGIYLPGRGGVRYEDTIIITEKGYTNLYP